MSTFDDIFGAIDWEYRQHLDVQQLKQDVSGIPDLIPALLNMRSRIDQLELMNKALVELVVSKNLVTREEIGVLLQQIDLLDGVEDGKISPDVHTRAPRCSTCNRYVNPKRVACVYCGAKLGAELKASAPKRPTRTVDCVTCGTNVLESDSYYSDHGVVCESCFVKVEG